jgi:hypothetical protein
LEALWLCDLVDPVNGWLDLVAAFLSQKSSFPFRNAAMMPAGSGATLRKTMCPVIPDRGFSILVCQNAFGPVSFLGKPDRSSHL